MASSPPMTTVHGSEAVERRIALYCRALGLDHVWVVDEITGDIMSGARQAGHGPDDAEFVRVAVAELMSSMRTCFDRLVPAPDALSPDARELLPWRMRAVLRQHPEAFYRGGDLTEDAQRVLSRAPHPVLPPEHRLDMPAQELGAPLGVFSKLFWKRAGGRLVSLGHAVFRGLASLGWRRG